MNDLITISDFLGAVNTGLTGFSALIALGTLLLAVRRARHDAVADEVRSTLIELSDLLGEQEIAQAGEYQRTRRMWVLIARLPHHRPGRMQTIRERLERTVMALEARKAEGVRRRYRPATLANPTLCRYGQDVISAALHKEPIPAETEELVRICTAARDDIEEMYHEIMG